MYAVIIKEKFQKRKIRNSDLLLLFPDNLFPGYEIVTFIAKKTCTAFGTDLELFAALGAVRIHVKFVAGGIALAELAEKPVPSRSKLLHHFRTAITAYPSYHVSLLCR